MALLRRSFSTPVSLLRELLCNLLYTLLEALKHSKLDNFVSYFPMAKAKKQQSYIRNYNDLFLHELEKLNPAQQKAVHHIEGPVLVIAGPGTGKTHILTARIGRILMETDTQPYNILCLTFTDAGVHAMRERLLEFIGPEAHRVHIYTFHSFCNNIIQDNLELFGRHDLEPISELEKVELIRKIIDELVVGHPLKRAGRGAYFYERHLQDLFSRMKSEDWSIQFLGKKIDQYLDDLPTREAFIYKRNSGVFRKGDLKKSKLEDELIKMEKLRAAVQLYPRYIELMRELRRYDFDDMILWVLRAFEKNENLLRQYQEQYLYFLVDEYQDTNGAQNHILQQLIHYWANPNVFIVGDDDQSIYEFQGARLKNLEDFYHDYKKSLELVVLKENYRSSQHILDSSHALIKQNEKRIITSLHDLGIEKFLLAQNAGIADTSVKPNLVEYQNKAQEEADLVDQIEKLYQSGFPINEIAIIYAKHKQSQNIIELLEKKKIPYNSKRRVNILDTPLIRNLRTFLNYLQTEFIRPHSGEYLLFRIMHFDFLKLNPNDLGRISIFMAKHDYNSRPNWRELLQDDATLRQIGIQNLSSIQQFSQLIDTLLREFTNYTPPILLERLFNRSGLLHQVIHHENKVWQLQLLSSFLDFVKKETTKNPRLSLSRLLDIFTNMDDNRLSIDVSRSIYADDGVNLLTAHSSKGLEFQQVFIIDAIKDNWEPKSRSSNFRFNFPDTITFSNEEDATEARRRLFYVAMTRAKEKLYISYSQYDNNGKALQRARFVDELVAHSDIGYHQKQLNPKLISEAQLLILLEKEAVQINLPDAQTVSALLEGFALSVSSLNTYLRCPLSFYYENVLRVPTVSSEAAANGTAMHNSLQRLFERMLLDKEKAFMNQDDFIKLFEYEMKRLRGYFTKKEYERRLVIGKNNLAKYYQENISDWRKQVKVEFDVRNVEIDGVPIKGVIDKVEYLEKEQVHLVDYKTGSLDKSKLSRPSEKKPNGGNYWRQLAFYKILFENHRDTTQVVKTAAISYLELDTQGRFPKKEMSFTLADIDKVKGMIISSYEKIMAHEFSEGCGESNCPWCNFIRANVIMGSLVDLEVEELDD